MASFNRFASQFRNNLNKAIEDAFSINYLSQTGNDIVKQIQVRTRSGFGVQQNNARQARLRPLSPQYVRSRRDAAKAGILSNTTSPQRSNLTYTGNMLASITSSASRSRIQFGFSNPEAVSTAEEVQSKGRPFFNLSSTEIRNLTRRFNARLRSFLIRV